MLGEAASGIAVGRVSKRGDFLSGSVDVSFGAGVVGCRPLLVI